MMLYPIINHINDLLPFIDGNKQFRVAEQPDGFKVVCYMVKDEDTFRGEHAFWYQECRGITFAPEGHVASRTLHKFPNVGENAESQIDVIDWSRVVRVMDKRDGSMITPVLMPNGSIKCKTKKTFTSNEAIAATELLHRVDNGQAELEWVRKILESGLTPTFEWTSPRFPIVLLYEKDELTLLQVRDNVTGEYDMDMKWWATREELCPFPIVENLIEDFMVDGKFDIQKMIDIALVKEGIEGWIVQLDDGQMYKVKTKWYCDLHHSVTFTRYRDVARTVLEDKSDDLKAAFALTGRDIQPIVEIEHIIFNRIGRWGSYVEEMAGCGRVLNRTAKDMALAHKDNALFGQIMTTFRGGQVDWLKYYLQNNIRDHSLEVIPQAGMDDIVETGEEDALDL